MSEWHFDRKMDSLIESVSLVSGRSQREVVRFAMALYIFLTREAVRGKKIAILRAARSIGRPVADRANLLKQHRRLAAIARRIVANHHSAGPGLSLAGWTLGSHQGSQRPMRLQTMSVNLKTETKNLHLPQSLCNRCSVPPRRR